ncbi:hypothetical protein TNCV_3006351 [Trichonephila clavipes]|nr:hypothetical protein TNCV_3006351 [Trichonephila clavipes]
MDNLKRHHLKVPEQPLVKTAAGTSSSESDAPSREGSNIFHLPRVWAMSQPLPLNSFKWVDFLDVDPIDENGDKGYILEVDLEYPESLYMIITRIYH